jgi:hypothetical protein
MKIKMLTLLVFSLLGSKSYQQVIDIDKEKEAIVAVIEDEKAGYINKDMDQWSKHVLQDSSYSWLYASSEIHILSHGFSTHADLINGWWENANPDMANVKVDFEIMELKVFPQTAWAAIKTMWNYDIKGEPVQEDGIEFLFFEKHDGSWKIACQTVLSVTSYEKAKEQEEEKDDEMEDKE